LKEGQDTVLFLIAFCTLYELVTLFLYLQFADHAPNSIRQLAYRIGLDINLFNFYHKGGKLVRLSWAIFAGLALAVWGKEWFTYYKKHWALSFIIAIGLAAAIITSVVRPLTYMTDGAVAEINAADYLIRNKADIKTIVLIEDFQQSMINQLVPISAFYFSTWSGGNPGLTHAVGTWADQYLPKSLRHESAHREAVNRLFFGNELSLSDKKTILRRHDIAYIVTRRKYDLQPLAALVVDHPGGYLYRVAKESR
jgi:hypothetical protein